MSEDRLDAIRADLESLEDRPVDERVPVLGRALDAVVAELDELARTTASSTRAGSSS